MADVDDPLLDEIAQSLDETERTGDPVSDKLALIANKRWNHKLSDDKLKEKAEKYPRPANCDKVVSPRVNPEIWAKLTRAVRGEDHKLFRVQTQLSTVTNLVVQATDMLLKAKSDPKSLKIDDLVRMNTDAVALVSHASHELAQKRREIIRPHLHRDYIELCSQEVPVTSLLFGDDLQTELTRIRATNKIGNTTNPSSHAPSQHRIYKPSTSNYGNKQPPFLWRGAQSYRRLENNNRRDDSYLQGANFNLCVKNVKDTITLLDQVGLVIHPEKSILYPTQKLVFLGFLLDSIKMIISLTGEKTQKIKEACQKLLQSPQPTIREVAGVIGMLTASFPGVMFGPLHYRHLDMDKTVALKIRKGNYNKTMTLSDEAKHELSWWVSSIESAYNVVSHGQADTTMTTDASKTGWGCSLAGTPTGGSWHSGESRNTLNGWKLKPYYSV
ncbi:Hypothetical predicted protein [Paramuricea clavata]|uniref:Uncharacterized protein n=1 Tax=Paramuricea clavata TaxID=317549 RepID=A0A6S7GLJ5_PARCT|nr:Hypothetical predicted protein [Paramuricea clavata]